MEIGDIVVHKHLTKSRNKKDNPQFEIVSIDEETEKCEVKLHKAASTPFDDKGKRKWKTPLDRLLTLDELPAYRKKLAEIAKKEAEEAKKREEERKKKEEEEKKKRAAELKELQRKIEENKKKMTEIEKENKEEKKAEEKGEEVKDAPGILIEVEGETDKKSVLIDA